MFSVFLLGGVLMESQKGHRSLRSEIEHHIKKHGYTLRKLSELTGINQGHLSAILNRNPPRAITIRQLDALAAAFGQVPGWLYELYEEECFSDGKVSRPRLVPYLIRCAEIGRQDCIESIVSKLLENPKHVSILFSVAEQLFETGKRKEAVPFYQLVIDNEKDSHDDCFVLAHYRLFQTLQGTNAEEHWEAVIRFDPYRKRLPEQYQLDALLKLANVCFMVQKWNQVEKYADELRALATAVYEDELRRRKSSKECEPLKTERHLVVYYGQGFLAKGVALQMQGRYEEAKKYVQGYADLGWFQLLDETGQREVEKFRIWAKANLYTLDLLMGNIDILPEYVDFLINHPAEIPAGLLTIMESASKYDFSIDHILEHFSEEINHFKNYQDLINISRYSHFGYCKAIYEYKRGRIAKALEETLSCLSLADRMNHHQALKRCAELFWEHRHHTSSHFV
jgi:transcriptional regulator with XRE-family HTH domain